MKPIRPTDEQPMNQRNIDAAVRLMGSARPSADLQSRVFACIEARMASRPVDRKSGWHFFRIPKLAFAAATAVLASAVIVAGSVEHSRHITLSTAGVRLAPASSGLGTASAVHLPTQPVKAAHHGRARSRRAADHGRASITRQVRKPAGVAVPDAPGLQR